MCMAEKLSISIVMQPEPGGHAGLRELDARRRLADKRPSIHCSGAAQRSTALLATNVDLLLLVCMYVRVYVPLDELNGESRLSYASTAHDYELVLSEKRGLHDDCACGLGWAGRAECMRALNWLATCNV